MADLDNLANANAELDKQVDELSKAGNEAELDKALTNEFNAATQEGDQPANKTPDTTPEEEAKAKAEAEANGTKTPEEIKAEEKANKFKNLLSDRNEAQEAAAKAELEAQTKEQRIKDLEAENERLKSGDKGTSNEDVTDEKPLTESRLKELLDERDSRRNETVNAEKTSIAEVDALKENKNTPNSEDYREEILQIMEKHKSISAYGAYKMLQGDGIIPFDNASANSNSGKLNTGDKTKANLLQDKKPSDMSDEELDKAVKEGYNTGQIKI